MKSKTIDWSKTNDWQKTRHMNLTVDKIIDVLWEQEIPSNYAPIILAKVIVLLDVDGLDIVNLTE